MLAKVFLSDKNYGSATTYESRHCVKFIFRDNENISVLKDNSNLILINSLFFFLLSLQRDRVSSKVSGCFVADARLKAPSTRVVVRLAIATPNP